ncbi:Cell division control protein 3 [Malassezia pachydermatis]|uniref:Cell division control gtp binding protein n=1 Tax=Malassezia pachydermatis TaxID=77020 RepID=A0A0M8MT34_9BASI|nr:cell division control gtp binding protein [Malassezia pachydermatis]KOS13230.1 cell division control gtp binding protein [Malassezia pachydermatis]
MASAPAATPAAVPAVPAVPRKKLTNYVGFANLPNQVHRASIRKGFTFTAMVVGETGLGKSTLINTLFNTNLVPSGEERVVGREPTQTVGIETISADIEENEVRLRLNLIDTPGFGDFVNNENAWEPILQTIRARFDAYLEQENRTSRSKIVDNRVHALLYFIQPTGHALRQIDLEFLTRLHKLVNVIPIIAKSDTVAESDMQTYKQRILRDLEFHGIDIVKLSTLGYEDEEMIAEVNEIQNRLPFAIVGSNDLVKTVDGRVVRGRAYPWGVIEVDNEEHCDFVKLRQMLIRSNMEDLRELTEVLYENYRASKLQELGISQDDSVFSDVNPSAKQAEARAVHEAKLAKMESDMKAVFQRKVAEKESKLKQSEEELYARHRQMRAALDQQRQELEERKRRLQNSLR